MTETTFRVGDWQTSNEAQNSWLKELTQEVAEKKVPLHSVLEEFKALIEHDPEVYLYINEMISQVPERYKENPEGGYQIENYDQMLRLINAVLTKAPEFDETILVPLPINVILDWSIGTSAGFAAFLNSKINAIFEKILNAWCEFLDSENSLYVLNDSNKGWMCKAAQEKIRINQYQYSKEKPFWGFKSWNAFFTREFKEGERPVAEPENDKVIVSACEATPYKISTGVQKYSNFWIKSQPYSLQFMLASDESVDQFVGGTVYQAFLSPFNYHRWRSPVTGTIQKAFVQKGTYYAEAPTVGLNPEEMNLSQSYITQVATRAIILIESDDPVIGLMCVVAVGMSEVSSCQITVKQGQRVRKGDLLGYFQYGGSTYCLVFRPGVIAEFTLNAIPQPSSQVVLVNSKIATAN
ncbi:MAG: phosphatidylserine decarboxylase family protein [Chroococcidiopsidaceae cyanobacterium CP_BM_ER_R8_30]|nr:phosphatidylserine decarboxylase family protein [Chroococcidiopsidaceae cyanobacterium CP_BM_ER_R8_30]